MGGFESYQKPLLTNPFLLILRPYSLPPTKTITTGGTLDTAELAQALTATVGKRYDINMAKPYMEKYDADASGTLDLTEFKALVKDVR